MENQFSHKGTKITGGTYKTLDAETADKRV